MAAPQKKTILNAGRRNRNNNFWKLSFGKRAAEEFYDLKKDPDCMHNLAGNPAFTKLKNGLKLQMEKELRDQNDPRLLGNGAIFDTYIYAEPKVQDYYNRFKKGEKIKAGWINESDYEEADF